MVDNKALGRLLAAKPMLTRQQYKTIKGQILSGNAEAAMKGLAKLTSPDNVPDEMRGGIPNKKGCNLC